MMQESGFNKTKPNEMRLMQ